MTLRTIGIALILLLTGGGTSGNATQPDSSSGGALRNSLGMVSFSPIVKNAAPAVVSIVALQMIEQRHSMFFDEPFYQFFFPEQPQQHVSQSLGSGVIVDAEGIILTCAHVVQNAKSIRVKLADNREFDADIVVVDSRNDLAAIRLKNVEIAQKLPFLKLNQRQSPEVGDVVLAIGNPFGVGQTVSSGIISALARNVEGRVLLQTDTPINPGNSGGALVDMNGELIAIPSVILSKTGASHGIGFAIPAAVIHSVLDAARSNGKIKRPWDGIYGQSLTQDIAESLNMKTPQGIIVADLHSQSPALAAGLKKGDVITAVNQIPISSAEDFALQIQGIGLENQIELDVYRSGEKNTVTYKSISPPEVPAADKTTFDDQHLFADITVANLSPAVAVEYNIFSKHLSGVVILKTGRNMLAHQLGLSKGDIIEQFNGQSVESVQKLKKISSKVLQQARITIRRGERQLTIQVQ